MVIIIILLFFRTQDINYNKSFNNYTYKIIKFFARKWYF